MLRCAFFLISLLLISFFQLAHASHFRGGGFTWTLEDMDNDGQLNDLIVLYSSACASGNDGCKGFGVTPALTAFSDVLTEYKVIDGYQYAQEKRVYKNISPTTQYTFLAQGGNRISGLQNNAGGSWYIQSIVYAENGNLPPQIDLPVLFDVPQLSPDQSRLTTWTYQIRGFDPNGDNYRFRLANSTEMGGGTNPSGLSISATGLLSWTGSGNNTAGLYSAGIVVNDLDNNGNTKAQSQFDLMFDLQNMSIAQYSTDLPLSNTLYVLQNESVSFNVIGTGVNGTIISSLGGALTEPMSNNFVFNATGLAPNTYSTTIQIGAAGRVMGYENVTFIVLDPLSPRLTNMDGEKQFFTSNKDIFIDVGRDAELIYSLNPDLNGGHIRFNADFTAGNATYSILQDADITISGNDIAYQGNVFAQFDALDTGVNQPLKINFTSAFATNDAVASLVRNTQYTSTAATLPSVNISGTIFIEDANGNSGVKPLSYYPLTASDPMMAVVQYLNGNTTTITAPQINAIDEVDGAVPANQAWYEEALLAAKDTGFVDSELPAPSEVQTLVTAVNAIVAAMGNDASQLSIEDYADAGIDGVNAGNLDYMNNLLTNYSYTSIAEIQTLADDYNTLVTQVIDDIAGNSDGTGITSGTLNGIMGVDGAEPENDDLYSDALNRAETTLFSDPTSPTPAEIDAVVDSVNVIVDVTEQTEPPTTLTPDDYNNVGITGVDADNVELISDQIATGTFPPLEDIQTLVDGYNNVVEDIGGNTDNNGVSADELNIIDGVDDAVPANDALYSEALSNASGTGFSDPNAPTPAEIDAVVDSVNAISDVITNGDQATDIPDETDFSAVGITGVTTTNLSGITDQLETGDFTDISQIQDLVDDYLEIVDDINSNGNMSSVTADQLNGISGVTTAVQTNDALYSEALGESDGGQFSDPNNPTSTEINTLVTAVNELADVINTQTGGTNLSEQDLIDAGIDTVTSDNLDFVQTQIESGTLTSIDDIEQMASGYTSVLSQISGGPSSSEVNATNLNAISGVSGADPANEPLYQEIIGLSSDFADPTAPTAPELNDVVEAANTLADVMSGGSTPVTDLTESLLADTGLDGVTPDNLTFIQTQISGRNLTTITEIQDAINGQTSIVTAINADPNNPPSPPSATDMNAIDGVNSADPANELLYQQALADLDTNAIADPSSPAADEIADLVVAVNTLSAVISGTTPSTNLDESLFDDMGIANVNSTNLPFIQTQIDNGSLTSIEDIRNMVDGYNNIIEDIAGNADNDGVTAEQLNAIDGVAVADPNFDSLYSEALAGAGTTAGFSNPINPTTSEINRVIYSVNDIGDVITNGDQSSTNLTELSYQDVGVEDVTTDNFTGINAQLESGDFTDIASIQTMVDSFNAISEDIQGNTDNTNVTATDLNGLSGVSGAEAANESLYAQALSQNTGEQFQDSDNPTAAEINALVDSTNLLATVITTQTSQETLTSEVFANTGINGVDADNIDFIQTQVATGNLTTIEAIEDMVTGYEAVLDQITNGVAGTGVSATNLNSIDGVTTATPANEALYSEAIAISQTSFSDASSPSSTELNDLVEAVNIIADVTSGNGLMTDIDIDVLLDAGIDNVNNSTLTFVRAQISSGNLTSLQDIQDAVNAYDQVITVAATEPNAQMALPVTITAAELNQMSGVAPAVSANDNLYTEALQMLPDSYFSDVNSPSVNEMNDMVNAVNALSQVIDGNASGSTLGTTLFTGLGVEDVDSANLVAIQTQIEGQNLGTIDAIQNMVTGINSVIEDFSGNNDGVNVTATELNNIDGVTGALLSNEGIYSDALQSAAADGLITNTGLTGGLLNDIVTSTNNLVAVYQNQVDDLPPPTVTPTDFVNLGIQGVDDDNVDDVIGFLEKTPFSTFDDLQDGVESFITIQTYASDPTNNDPPELSDYENINLTNVFNDNYDMVNDAISDGTFNSLFNDELSFQALEEEIEKANENRWAGVIPPTNKSPVVKDETVTLTRLAFKEIDVLQNDFDPDMDTLSLHGIDAADYDLRIINNKVHYTPKSSDPNTLQIEYVVTDGLGGLTTGQLNIINEWDKPIGTPTFNIANEETIRATGLFSPVDLDYPLAYNAKGNKLAVSLKSNSLYLQPGRNIVEWVAYDPETGTETLQSQLINVEPTISFQKDMVTIEGSKPTLSLFLNGDSPTYPLRVPFTVSGTSDSNDHNLVDGEFIFEDGIEAKVQFEIYKDFPTDDLEEETIVVTISEDINRGVKPSITLSISEVPIKPSFNISYLQQDKRIAVASRADGPVKIIGEIYYPDGNVDLDFDWQVNLPYTANHDFELEIATVDMTEDIIEVEGRVWVAGAMNTYVNAKSHLKIKDALPQLEADKDSDNDGIPDAIEGHTDADNDGIPDYLDSMKACELIQEDIDFHPETGYILESTPGTCLRLGTLSIKSDTFSTAVPEQKADFIQDDLVEQSFGDTKIFNFVVEKSAEISEIVIPLEKPIDSSSRYRKYNYNTQTWFDYVEDANNFIKSYSGEPGFCPPPGSDLYTDGLKVGDYCMELTIEEGGPNDVDGIQNGQIDDPGYVTYSTSEPLTAQSPDFEIYYDQTLVIDVCEYINQPCTNVSMQSFDDGPFDIVPLSANIFMITNPQEYVGDDALGLTIIADGQVTRMSYNLNVLGFDGTDESVTSGGRISLELFMLMFLLFISQYKRRYPLQ